MLLIDIHIVSSVSARFQLENYNAPARFGSSWKIPARTHHLAMYLLIHKITMKIRLRSKGRKQFVDREDCVQLKTFRGLKKFFWDNFRDFREGSDHPFLDQGGVVLRAWCQKATLNIGLLYLSTKSFLCF